MIGMSLRVNDFLSGMFAAVGIKLVDFKLEFGRLFEDDMVRTILADEISPDSCRLWDMETGDKLDKDRFRQDLGGVTDAYARSRKTSWHRQTIRHGRKRRYIGVQRSFEIVSASTGRTQDDT